MEGKKKAQSARIIEVLIFPPRGDKWGDALGVTFQYVKSGCEPHRLLFTLSPTCVIFVV